MDTCTLATPPWNSLLRPRVRVSMHTVTLTTHLKDTTCYWACDGELSELWPFKPRFQTSEKATFHADFGEPPSVAETWHLNNSRLCWQAIYKELQTGRQQQLGYIFNLCQPRARVSHVRVWLATLRDGVMAGVMEKKQENQTKWWALQLRYKLTSHGMCVCDVDVEQGWASVITGPNYWTRISNALNTFLCSLSICGVA